MPILRHVCTFGKQKFHSICTICVGHFPIKSKIWQMLAFSIEHGPTYLTEVNLCIKGNDLHTIL